MLVQVRMFGGTFQVPCVSVKWVPPTFHFVSVPKLFILSTWTTFMRYGMTRKSIKQSEHKSNPRARRVRLPRSKGRQEQEQHVALLQQPAQVQAGRRLHRQHPQEVVGGTSLGRCCMLFVGLVARLRDVGAKGTDASQCHLVKCSYPFLCLSFFLCRLQEYDLLEVHHGYVQVCPISIRALLVAVRQRNRSHFCFVFCTARSRTCVRAPLVAVSDSRGGPELAVRPRAGARTRQDQERPQGPRARSHVLPPHARLLRHGARRRHGCVGAACRVRRAAYLCFTRTQPAAVT